MKKSNLFKNGILSILLMFLSCGKDNHDDHNHDHDEENITKVTYNITQNGKTNSYSWEEGKTQPTISLTQGTAEVSVQFFNEKEEVTPEIITEKNTHFIVYGFTNSKTIVLKRVDDASSTRTDGKKLGIKTSWTISADGTNDVNIKLIHEPSSVNDEGTGNYSGGSTDVDATLKINVETSKK